MLYHLLYPLHETIGAFNVFRYITFRSALAALTALVLSLGLGRFLIAKLREMQVGQHIREEGPQSHYSKKGTPTMGGILIILSVVFPTLLWADLGNIFVWIAVLSMIAFGLIGFYDDYRKVQKKRNLGLTARAKFALQIVVALGIGLVLLWLSHHELFTTRLSLPFLKQWTPDLGWLYAVFIVVVIVGAANAVNLTDGLDGLAIGSALVAAATFAILSYVVGNAVAASYLGIINVKGTGELTVFCAALVGASLGFLWYNCNPAEVFMGDVGSMALGGAIGTVAVLTKQEVLLVMVGGLFVIEAMSVIIQVASFRLTGRRVFRMAPLHHHFELQGWPEPKVIIRFWILAILFALMSLSTLKLR
ncbi:MAG TPA: phospho-N-acetylmuramoyl-pentapeptide-transferase [Candidatus Polarisedimenticolia bacterium]|nr:phospho-N-acetylmuramoyl-pentapeptide-transferase [Candidatus Polarisedimenticolia bacterium]